MDPGVSSELLYSVDDSHPLVFLFRDQGTTVHLSGDDGTNKMKSKILIYVSLLQDRIISINKYQRMIVDCNQYFLIQFFKI